MKLGIERMHLNIIEAVYEKPITNILLMGKKLKPFPLTSGMGHFLSTFIQHSSGIQGRAIIQGEEI
jgi:hypothetical protein